MIFILSKFILFLLWRSDHQVQSLQIITTPMELYYDLQVNFFEILDYKKEDTHQALVKLLTIEGLNFKNLYEEASLDVEQLKSLIDEYFSDKTLHPLVFPTIMISRKADLVDVFRPYLPNYFPGVIKLGFSNFFSQPDLRHLLYNLGPHPEFCGNRQVNLLAATSGFAGNWQYHEDLNAPRASENPTSSLFVQLSRFFDDRETPSEIDQVDYEDNDPIRVILHQISHLGDMWEFAVNDLEQYLDYCTMKMIDSRMLYWKTIFLSYIAYHISINERRKTSPVRWRRYVRILEEKIIALLEEYAIEKVPSVAMLWLIEMAFRCRVNLSKSRLGLKKLKEINSISPTLPCIGGTKGMYIEKWYNYLRTRRKHVTVAPLHRVTLHQALEWWADYDELVEILYLGPTFSPPLMILEDSGGYRVFGKVDDFVRFLSNHLWETLGERLLRDRPKMAPISVMEIKAFARTLFTNFLFSGHLGFALRFNDLWWLYRDKSRRRYSHSIALLRRFASDTGIQKFIPRSMAIGKHVDLCYYHEAQSIAAVFVTCGTILFLLFSLIAFIIYSEVSVAIASSAS